MPPRTGRVSSRRYRDETLPHDTAPPGPGTPKAPARGKRSFGLLRRRSDAILSSRTPQPDTRHPSRTPWQTAGVPAGFCRDLLSPSEPGRAPRLTRHEPNSVGAYMCTDLACSLYVRGRKDAVPGGRLNESLTVEEQIARTRGNLFAFLDRL
ncbi:FBP domain-containing protein [Streptomyces formicae]|uniref:FBP domain-containing protein n=1 Tax=Streptomyces formicae TaxID=1616117 RepID=A0ABY3X282_9ACTN|nr:FBP domain-containing protein [Streptomyces formicae]